MLRTWLTRVAPGKDPHETAVTLVEVLKQLHKGDLRKVVVLVTGLRVTKGKPQLKVVKPVKTTGKAKS